MILEIKATTISENDQLQTMKTTFQLVQLNQKLKKLKLLKETWIFLNKMFLMRNKIFQLNYKIKKSKQRFI